MTATTKPATPAQFWAACEAIGGTAKGAERLGFGAEGGCPECIAALNVELGKCGLHVDAPIGAEAA